MTARRLKFPGQLDAQRFLDLHWQKKPLRIADAIAVELPTLTANELAWLATLDDVESRLVFTERHEDNVTYRVEHGPFASAELEELPRQDWTLLVQDVDKHLPDFRAYFELTNFVPDWRIDDLMVSFASPGDILYLPPRVPHWGIAETQCITYSIGMRAPTLAEFIDHLEDAGSRDQVASTDIFYQDPDLSTQEAMAGFVSRLAIKRMRTTLGADSDLTDERIATTLGSIVTTPKPWLAPATMSSESARSALSTVDPEGELMLHGMSRLAYYESTDAIKIFANGSSQAADPANSALIQDLCKKRAITAKALQHALDDRGKEEVIQWLCEQGIFDL